MKLTKQTKFALAIVLVYLTSFAELTQLESTIRLNKKSALQSNSKNLISSKTSAFVLTAFPLVNFIIGVFESMGGDSAKLTKCVPEDWKKKGKAIDDATTTMNNSFASWIEGLKNFMNAGKPVINFLCGKRDLVMKLISGLVLKTMKEEKRRKFREISFLQTNMQKKISSKRFVSATYMRNHRAIMAVSETKVQWLWNDIANKIFTTWFKPILKHVMKLVKGVIKMFTNKLFGFIKKALGCVKTLKKGVAAVFKTFNKLMDKFEVLVKASANPVILVITIIDYIVAMVCNWENFEKAVNFLAGGLNEEDVKKKWLLLGKALGSLLYALGSSNTFSLKEYGNVQKLISK